MDIVALVPDVILTGGAAPLAELLQATRTVPIDRRVGLVRLCRLGHDVPWVKA
jgi:hypothetical protein